MDMCTKETLTIFINRVLGQSVKDGDLERSGEELLTYKNIEADTAKKRHADCVTGVN